MEDHVIQAVFKHIPVCMYLHRSGLVCGRNGVKGKGLTLQASSVSL